MFTDITWQDYLITRDREALLLEAIRRCKASPAFNQALEANSYFHGENPAVARKTILRAKKISAVDAQGRRRARTGTEDVVGNRIASAFLFRFVTQQNQFLLSEGVSLPEDCKQALGGDFDHQLERLGECALLHGCAWGFWNVPFIRTTWPWTWTRSPAAAAPSSRKAPCPVCAWCGSCGSTPPRKGG